MPIGSSPYLLRHLPNQNLPETPVYKRIALLGTILLLNSGIVRQPAIAQFLPRLPDFDSNSLEKEGRDLLGESLQLAQLQQVDLAITRAKLATQLIPQNADAWAVLGGLYLVDNQTDKSIISLQKAQGLNPKEAAIWLRLGNAYFQKKEYAKSVDALQSGIKLSPNAKAMPAALFDLGNAYFMMGKTDEAIATYTKSNGLDKKFWFPLNNIALIRYETGDTEEAIRLWNTSLGVDAKASEPKLALAVALYQQGNTEKALTLGESALSVDSRYGDLVFLKDNLWGSKLLADTTKFLEQPRIKTAIANAKATEAQAPSSSSSR
jgi:tetratricopeptide (TPR) repeat protein